MWRGERGKQRLWKRLEVLKSSCLELPVTPDLPSHGCTACHHHHGLGKPSTHGWCGRGGDPRGHWLTAPATKERGRAPTEPALYPHRDPPAPWSSEKKSRLRACVSQCPNASRESLTSIASSPRLLRRPPDPPRRSAYDLHAKRVICQSTEE